jgi:toxin ParE1/3/4
MSRNKGFVLSSKAQDDLGAIWDYTVQRWGADQAEHYIRDIQDAVLGLVAGTKPSQPIDDIRPGYRKALIGVHLLLFRVEDTGAVNIVRILHSRMDTERYL